MEHATCVAQQKLGNGRSRVESGSWCIFQEGTQKVE